MGVWVEIRMSFNVTNNITVTPCVGVWVEIVTMEVYNHISASLPAWECGLKLKMLKEEYGD